MNDISELAEDFGIDLGEETTTFLDWGTLRERDYNTKGNWKYSCGLVVRKGEQSRASYEKGKTFTPERWREQKRQFENKRMELEPFPDRLQRFREFERSLRIGPVVNGQMRVVFKNVPVFHRSQMAPGNFKARTVATLEFCKIFWSQSPHGNYIKRNPDPENAKKWFTKDISKMDSELEPFRFLNGQMIQDHLNHRDIYGVKADAGKSQWWVAADLDLHLSTGGRPDIFLKQAEALLAFLHGNGWITCLPSGVISGIHVLKIFKTPRPVEQIRRTMRKMLEELSALHPELEQDAVAVDMKPLKALEIFPHISLGFRLPLGKGYTALLDRSLDLVKYHTYQGVPRFGGDVESLMNWNGKEMTVEAKMAYIIERVPKTVSEEVGLLRRQVAVERTSEVELLDSVAQLIGSGKVLGSMKGCYTKVLTQFFSGKRQEPKSLQVGLLLGANALWAQGYPYEDRAEYLLDLVQQIEVTNPAFSSRINNGDWETISDDIDNTVDSVEKVHSSPKPSVQIEKSNAILRRWSIAMDILGFNFGDRSTWEMTHRNLDIEFNDEEQKSIRLELMPVLKTDFETAVAFVKKVVRIVVNKARKKHGISREYRRAILTDLGISCQENVKLAESWRVLDRLGFIVLVKEGTFSKDKKAKGHANVYSVGERLSLRVYGQEKAVLPSWLAEEMEAAGRQCNWIIDDDDVNSPDDGAMPGDD